MQYIAIFDIPDENSIGCAVAMTCPNDGKIRSDSDHDKVYANTVKMSEYLKPRWLETQFYRRLVLDHMRAAGMNIEFPDDLREKENVKKRTIEVMKTQNMKGAHMRRAFYLGQLSLLDYIAEMQETYLVPSKGEK